MEISPWEAIGLNCAYGILTGLSLPIIDALGFGSHDTVILAWAGIVAIPLNAILHGLSSSVPGPLAPPDSPAVKAAMAKDAA
jgi:hypothetical protein